MNGALVAGTIVLIFTTLTTLTVCIASYISGKKTARESAKSMATLSTNFKSAQEKNEKEHKYFRAHFVSLNEKFRYFSKDTEQMENDVEDLSSKFKNLNLKLTQEVPR